MANDLPRSFHEEAAEHLVTMESLLRTGNLRRAEPETLDAILRAVHSIRSGAGVFGHAALGDFAEVLESAFGGARKGEIAITRSLVGTFLRSVEALRAHASLRPVADDSLDAMKRELCAAVAQATRIREGLDAPIALPAKRVEPALDAAEISERARGA